MTKQEISQLEVNYQVVKAKFEIAQELITHEGFYKYWFEQLALPRNSKKSKTKIFEEVNYLYQIIFKMEKGRYSSYQSFLNSIRLIRKSKMKR